MVLQNDRVAKSAQSVMIAEKPGHMAMFCWSKNFCKNGTFTCAGENDKCKCHKCVEIWYIERNCRLAIDDLENKADTVMLLTPSFNPETSVSKQCAQTETLNHVSTATVGSIECNRAMRTFKTPSCLICSETRIKSKKLLLSSDNKEHSGDWKHLNRRKFLLKEKEFMSIWYPNTAQCQEWANHLLKETWVD